MLKFGYKMVRGLALATILADALYSSLTSFSPLSWSVLAGGLVMLAYSAEEK